MEANIEADDSGIDPMLYERRYKLLHSILQHETTLLTRLRNEGRHQIEYPRSREGWMITIFNIRGRALDTVLVPWLAAVLHAIAYTLVQELYLKMESRQTD